MERFYVEGEGCAHSGPLPSNLPGDTGRPFAVESFCGSAGLTRELQRVGFEALGIDWEKCEHVPRGRVLRLDLSTTHGQQIMQRALLHPRLAYVHFSPPCGTCSRARERKIKASLLAAGVFEPKPLRSEAFPEGLPDLAAKFPSQVIRVKTANVLYRWCTDAALQLHARGIPWTMENPRRSLFWWLPCTLRTAPSTLSEVQDVVFQNCMHGGKRDKWTRLRCGHADAFAALQATCDRSHQHAPWGPKSPSCGGFYSAEEAEFPQQLCQKMAKAAWEAAEACGINLGATIEATTSAQIGPSSADGPAKKGVLGIAGRARF